MDGLEISNPWQGGSLSTATLTRFRLWMLCSGPKALQ